MPTALRGHESTLSLKTCPRKAVRPSKRETVERPDLAVPDQPADDSSFAADDEFLARRQRNARRRRVVLLVLLFAAIVVPAGIFLGPLLLPERTGPLQTAYHDLLRLHKEIEAVAGGREDAAQWKIYAGRVSKQLHDATKPIAPSKHRAKPPLMGARSALTGAVRANSQDDFDRKLKQAAKMLDDAAKKLNI